MQSGYPWNQSEEVPDVYGGSDLRNRKVLSLEWKNDGVMMTLGRWDDCGVEMNQEEADQDVVDEVSEEVDSRGRAMRSERNDW